MIEYDIDRTKRHRMTTLPDAKLWQVIVVILAFVSLLAVAWVLFSQNDQGVRDVELIDIVNLQVDMISEIERDGVRVFHGRIGTESVGPHVSVVYADSRAGVEFLETDHFDLEREWLTTRNPEAVHSWFVVRNALVLCLGITRCEELARGLERVTGEEPPRRYSTGRNP